MSKIRETFHEDGEKLVIKQTHDFNPVLNKASQLRSMGKTDFGDSKLVGLVPMKLWHEWAKKWGVNANDSNAMREVIAREMNNADNAQFRVWEGRY